MEENKKKMDVVKSYGSNISGNISREKSKKDGKYYYKYNIIRKSNNEDYPDNWFSFFDREMSAMENLIDEFKKFKITEGTA